MKIALLSSAIPCNDQKLIDAVNNVAKVLSTNNVELVTGGCTGVPELAIRKMVALNGITSVFSPDANEQDHQLRSDNLPLGVAHKYYFQSGFTQRSIDMLKHVDGAIVMHGRVGTLSEFTMAVEETLPVVVLTDTGGIAEHLDYILKLARKEFPNNFIAFADDPVSGVTQLIEHIKKTKSK